MSSILIHAWIVYRYQGQYFLPYTHWIYLEEISNYYDDICLLSPLVELDDEPFGLRCLDGVPHVTVSSLPPNVSYISSLKSFFSYFYSYFKLRHYSVSYVRYPTPFGWLQKVFMRGHRIIHYVGDPVDTVRNNRSISPFRQFLYATLFFPEFLMYMWASRGRVSVYTNGVHLAAKIRRFGVSAKSMTSSTLRDKDYYFDADKRISDSAPRFLYVGYLRKAKGVETLVDAFSIIIQTFPRAELEIIGSGEMLDVLRRRVHESNLSGVSFLGHVDDREVLNQAFRRSDIFCFLSLSEGSPRVVLEAMANGVSVISTPVGSLPDIFHDMEDIVFSNFDDPKMFSDKAEALIRSPDTAFKIAERAFHKSKQMSLREFIKEIFHVA